MLAVSKTSKPCATARMRLPCSDPVPLDRSLAASWSASFGVTDSGQVEVVGKLPAERKFQESSTTESAALQQAASQLLLAPGSSLGTTHLPLSVLSALAKEQVSSIACGWNHTLIVTQGKQARHCFSQPIVRWQTL